MIIIISGLFIYLFFYTQVNHSPEHFPCILFSPNSSLHASSTRPPKSPLYLLLSASCLHSVHSGLCPSDVLVPDPLVIAKEKLNI